MDLIKCFKHFDPSFHFKTWRTDGWTNNRENGDLLELSTTKNKTKYNTKQNENQSELNLLMLLVQLLLLLLLLSYLSSGAINFQFFFFFCFGNRAGDFCFEWNQVQRADWWRPRPYAWIVSDIIDGDSISFTFSSFLDPIHLRRSAQLRHNYRYHLSWGEFGEMDLQQFDWKQNWHRLPLSISHLRNPGWRREGRQEGGGGREPRDDSPNAIKFTMLIETGPYLQVGLFQVEFSRKRRRVETRQRATETCRQHAPPPKWSQRRSLPSLMKATTTSWRRGRRRRRKCQEYSNISLLMIEKCDLGLFGLCPHYNGWQEDSRSLT